jgi:restriction endonuclease S subunit
VSTISKTILRNTGWEKYKIKDIGELGRGRVINSIEINSQRNPKYPVYSSQTSNNGIMGYLDGYDFEGEYITWTTDGANAGTVFYREGRFNCTNVCGTIKIKNRHNPYFVAHCLQLETRKYVSTDLANPKLMNNTMACIEVPLPNIDIQNSISKLLICIDLRLKNEKEISSEYVNMKKYLLSNLFV